VQFAGAPALRSAVWSRAGLEPGATILKGVATRKPLRSTRGRICVPTMPNINKLFDKAEKLLQKERFDAAREVFLEILHYQPDDETALLRLGELSAKLNRKSDALQYWERLMDLYLAGEDASKAVVIGRKILKIGPRETAVLAKLAPAFEKARKPDEALDAYREILQAYRAAGEKALALECLQHIVKLDPEDLEAHAELGERAAQAGEPAQAAAELLIGAELARQKGMDGRWADWVARAHELDPANQEGCLRAAEVALAQGRPADVVALLEPVVPSRPDDLAVLGYLAQAYLSTDNYVMAQPICRKIYQSDPEAIGMIEQLIKGLLNGNEIEEALSLIQEIKGRFYRQGKANDFVAIVERAYQADEDNLEILEMLVALYNELNRDEGVRRSLARLFHLYLATEQYEHAAETLEKIIDLDPYGAGHQDRLLNLEGHLDPVWYKNIGRRLQVPGTDRSVWASLEAGSAEEYRAVTLDELIVESEMYQRYRLSAKLDDTLKRINRLYPGAQEGDDRLQGLYDAAGFLPTPAPAAEPEAPEAVQGPASAQGQGIPQPVEEFGKISRITTRIYREGSPEKVMGIAVEQIGLALDADRCWAAMGSPGLAPVLTAEYQSSGTASSDAAAAARVYSFFMRRENSHSEEWSVPEVAGLAALQPIGQDLQELGVVSLLGIPLTDKEQLVGLLLVEQCRAAREWTPGEKMLLEAVGPQVVTAINNAKLRRLVRSLAGTDPATGLLPRTAYLDCLLAEAGRAKEQSRPLAVCLMEPRGASELVKNFGEAKFQGYLQQVSQFFSAHLRQNDVAVRYGPCTVAVCFPDTPAAQARRAVEKLRDDLGKIEFDSERPLDFCAAVCDLPLGEGFDAVDGVTEAVNRLESLMDRVREKGETEILVSSFDEQPA